VLSSYNISNDRLTGMGVGLQVPMGNKFVKKQFYGEIRGRQGGRVAQMYKPRFGNRDSRSRGTSQHRVLSGSKSRMTLSIHQDL